MEYIPSSAILKGLDGKTYKLKAKLVEEIYPMAKDEAICQDLKWTNSETSQVPQDLYGIFQEPHNMNQNFPNVVDYNNNYLNGGQPVVINGRLKSF